MIQPTKQVAGDEAAQSWQIMPTWISVLVVIYDFGQHWKSMYKQKNIWQQNWTRDQKRLPRNSNQAILQIICCKKIWWNICWSDNTYMCII